ncbi:MAG: hypothetical protein FIA98_09130 [Anaerolineae bacterium]|nr:hypothetical protein [Anaerolineae bacterium]
MASLPVKPSVAASPTSKQNSPAGFTESDCYASGITLDSITTGNSVDEIYDGPYINCNYSTTGAHGLSETAYISIIAYKADMLDGFYMDLKDNLSGYVDQSNEWNAQPDLPAEAMDVIDMLRDDSDGYVFMITKDANVQGCKLGKGYGTEMVNGKYLVQIMFSSCEGDTSSYLAALDSLKSAAEVAIYRIETGTQP